MIEYTDKLTDPIRNEIEQFPLISLGENARKVVKGAEYVVVAVENATKEVVGYAIVEPPSLHEPAGVHYIEVSKGFRRRGIGADLIGRIKSYAKERGYDRLAYFATNASRPFAEKVGFRGNHNNLECVL